MSKEIKGIHLKFNCTAGWDKMQEVAEGCKFCDLCQKKVYDFTSKKAEDYFEALAYNPNGICGKFRPEQLAPGHDKRYWKKWITAALVLIGLNIFERPANAQKIISGNITQHKHDDSEIKITERIGSAHVKPSPSFPGGDPALFRFIYKHLRHVKDAPPKPVIARFEITKTGKVKDVTIIRGTSKAADKEVRRVLRTTPDWIPAKQNGKAVASTYYVPVHVLNK